MYDTDGKPCPPTGAPPPTTTSLCLDTQRRPSSDDHSHANDLGDPPPYSNCRLILALSKYYYTYMQGSHATMTIFRSVTARVARAARGEREWTIKSKWNNFTVDN